MKEMIPAKYVDDYTDMEGNEPVHLSTFSDRLSFKPITPTVITRSRPEMNLISIRNDLLATSLADDVRRLET